MPEEVKEPEVQAGQESPKEDLITRVSKIKADAPEVESKFNVNDLDAAIEGIPDPKVKEQILGLKKSLISGENQKYQELARLRKEYEEKIAGNSTWTPDRVQQLMADQSFVKAAQDIVGTTQDDSSMLSESEKARIKALDTEIKMLKSASMRASQQQQDEVLKSRYANYDPQAVDIITADLLAGKVQATREDLWKVKDYESAVQRAYRLGKQDRQLDTIEKVESSSIDGGTVTNTENAPAKEDGESDNAYFKRLGLRNLSKFQNRPK